MTPTGLKRLRLEPGEALRSQLAQQLFDNDEDVLQAGERVGAFRIVGEIGRGGLGIVYRAERDDGSYSQQVALKVMAGDADPALAERLLDRERRLLARLQHPGIARLIDGGRTDGGRLWFAMEVVEGERLDHYCERRGLPGLERLRLFLQVCDAVDYAHAQLVVHRDLKPANILVDARGQVRLLDFGIAAALDDVAGQAPQAGTPGFASPEQNRGDAAGVGDDIFQLGRLLDLLTAAAAPPRNRHRDLAAILRRALDATPASRYRTAGALAADVQALLELRPVAATGGARRYRAGRFLHRHRLALMGALAVAAALAALTGTYVRQVGLANAEAEAARRRAEDDAAAARAVTEFMVSVFAQADPALHKGEKPSIDTVLEAGTARIENELHDKPRIRAAILFALSGIHLRLRHDQQGYRLAEAARALIGHGAEFTRAELAELLLRQPMPDDLAQAAIARYQSVIDLLDPDDPKTIRTLLYVKLRMASTYPFMGDYPRALALLDEHRYLNRTHGLPEEASVLQLQSLLLGQLERYDEALAMAEQAWTATVEQRGALHPYTVLGSGDLAMARADAGRFAQAHAAADHAIDLAVRLYGKDDGSHLLWSRMRKAYVWLREGRSEHAASLLREVLAASDRYAPGDDASSVTAADWLGEALFAQGDLAGAEAAWRDAEARAVAGRSAQRPDLGQRALWLAQASAGQGRCAEALDRLRAAREHAAAAFDGHPIHARLRGLPGCRERAAGD
ncbi:serine/threonine-protein kinase [Dokdonella koreensis]|uniref:Serine/threonine protein kinase n=1 Tax=Dokdonella koreensis DS-123 TaxID=1300342 RepID=A0A167G4R0_9GAMM|nr:serine/threonine-protein kinase [Dokdonella koreensis]ANB16155.1 Serine/threonine protein kinase [Dokdonella koreensis DS-123]